jgi:hypothetical protein
VLRIVEGARTAFEMRRFRHAGCTLVDAAGGERRIIERA